MSSRVRRQQAAEGHPDILEAAVEIVAERGFERTRLADIAERAGTSISTLQFLFKNRETLIYHALQWAIDVEFVEVSQHAESIADPRARLVWLLQTFMAGTTPEETKQEWLVWSEYWRAAIRDESRRDACLDVYRRWELLLRKPILDCVEAGFFPMPDNLDVTLRWVVALGDGLGVQIVLGVGPSWDQAGEVLVDFFERSLGITLRG